MKTIKLKNGIEMPVLGFGVCQVAHCNQGGDGAGKDRTYFRLFTGYGLSGKFLREKGDRCHRTMAKGRNERFA